jgi:excisionase family DNA binding protein
MPKLAENRTGEPIKPSEDEALEIGKYAERIEQSGFLFEMPAVLAKAVRLLMSELGRGHGVAIVPYGRELTTQQAADLLGVSRPFLIQLVDRGDLTAVMVGTHRRIALDDVLRYKEQRSDERRRILRDLTSEGQRIGLEP